MSVVVPTFNEAANVNKLIANLEAALAGIFWEVIFVDDNSADGTAAIAFGTRNGSVYASVDEGETFSEVATRLPDVLSVRISA